MHVLTVNNAKAEAQWQELPSPKVEKGEIYSQVEAAELNRANPPQIRESLSWKV